MNFSWFGGWTCDFRSTVLHRSTRVGDSVPSWSASAKSTGVPLGNRGQVGRSKLQKSLGGPPEKSIKNEGLNFWKMDEAAKTIKHCFRYQDDIKYFANCRCANVGNSWQFVMAGNASTRQRWLLPADRMDLWHSTWWVHGPLVAGTMAMTWTNWVW